MAEWEAAFARHDEQIKTLFNQQKEIKDIAESTNKLALALEKLTAEMCSQKTRLEAIEETARYKNRTVWACVVTGVLGAIVASGVAALLG